MTLRVGIVVGEPSGDRLGAQLVTELKKQYPDIEIEGVIGREMMAAGCVQLCSMDILGVVGFVDPLLNIRSILRMRKWVINYFLADPPDVFIGIDAPDFNLGLERIFRDAGIPTVHFVSPSVWAWRKWRIKKIKKAVDLMLTLFPFEKKFYDGHQVPVCYTGHPTADMVSLVIDKAAAKEVLGFEHNAKVVALLPGSRNSELKYMTREYLKAANICSIKHPELRFVMPLVQPAYQEYVEYWRNKLTPALQIKYVIGDSFSVMRAADFAITTSGTATLEMMLHKVPMIVAYKLNAPTYAIAKLLVKLKHISLPNLLADDSIVPEYIQSNANAINLAAGLNALIESPELQQKQTTKFFELHQELQQNAASKAVSAIFKLLNVT